MRSSRTLCTLCCCCVGSFSAGTFSFFSQSFLFQAVFLQLQPKQDSKHPLDGKMKRIKRRGRRERSGHKGRQLLRGSTVPIMAAVSHFRSCTELHRSLSDPISLPDTRRHNTANYYLFHFSLSPPPYSPSILPTWPRLYILSISVRIPPPPHLHLHLPCPFISPISLSESWVTPLLFLCFTPLDLQIHVSLLPASTIPALSFWDTSCDRCSCGYMEWNFLLFVIYVARYWLTKNPHLESRTWRRFAVMKVMNLSSSTSSSLSTSNAILFFFFFSKSVCFMCNLCIRRCCLFLSFVLGWPYVVNGRLKSMNSLILFLSTCLLVLILSSPPPLPPSLPPSASTSCCCCW